MKYRVDVTRPARQDIGDIYAYLREHKPGYADRWLVGVNHAMGTLSEMPHRCPVARESETATGTVRNLFFDDYRFVYEVVGRRVDVLHVRHMSL
ncbi:MAG TPA: type II toxin-antitoxin system RelE/ParE family toxin [Longimicrobium sp.]|nr:type II toxin-antitoxin system RelE/ParE family toxin [Longimicrobium sp.]